MALDMHGRPNCRDVRPLEGGQPMTLAMRSICVHLLRAILMGRVHPNLDHDWSHNCFTRVEQSGSLNASLIRLAGTILWTAVNDLLGGLLCAVAPSRLFPYPSVESLI